MNPGSGLPLVLASILSLAGCATDAAEPDPAAGADVTLLPGETHELPDGARLRYVEVLADSRCPPGVQCIRAGEARLRFEVERGAGAPQGLVLDTAGRRSGELAGWRLELVRLEFGPAPPATLRVHPANPPADR